MFHSGTKDASKVKTLHYGKQSTWKGKKNGTETLTGLKSKQVALCSWIYYLLIAATTNVLIKFICQSSGHESVSMPGVSPTQDNVTGPDLEILPAREDTADGCRP